MTTDVLVNPELLAIPIDAETITDERMLGPEHIELLVAQAQAGDAEAFGTLYGQLAPSIYGVAFQRTRGDSEWAADCTQITFEKAFRHLERYQPGNFSSWLHRIGFNTFIDEYNRRGRHRTVTPVGGDVIEMLAAVPAPDNTETEAIAHLDPGVEQLLAHVSQPFRDAVELTVIEGLTYQEAGERLGIPRATVGTRRLRGLNQLRRYFGFEASEQDDSSVSA